MVWFFLFEKFVLLLFMLELVCIGYWVLVGVGGGMIIEYFYIYLVYLNKGIDFFWLIGGMNVLLEGEVFNFF